MNYFSFSLFFAFAYGASYTVLNTNEYLATNDTLHFHSPNAPYYAIMQDDGNFCVYKGTGPSNNLGGVWCSNPPPVSGSDYYALMQDDGNFCVYKGTGPSNNLGYRWCTMALNDIGDVINNRLLLTDCGILKTYAITSTSHKKLWSSSSDTMAGACNSFALIISSDPQYVFCGKDGIDYCAINCPQSVPLDPFDKDSLASSICIYNMIKSQYQSMASLKANYNGNIQGVIVNGDITDYGHDWQLNKYKNELVNYLNMPYYLGLGNHDVGNNFPSDGSFPPDGGCGPAPYTECATRMVQYMHDFIQRRFSNFDFVENIISGVESIYEGSLAYSFDIFNIHIVQLQNYPTYTRSWYNYQGWPPKTSHVNIRSSMRWLTTDLANARAAGKNIIINMHHYGHLPCESGPDYWDTTEFDNLVQIYRVTAIFAGHYHSHLGFRGYTNTGIPVFRTGAAIYQTYLLSEFSTATNQLTVKNVKNDLSGNPIVTNIEFSVPLERPFTSQIVLSGNLTLNDGDIVTIQTLDGNYLKSFNSLVNQTVIESYLSYPDEFSTFVVKIVDAASKKITLKSVQGYCKRFSYWNGVSIMSVTDVADGFSLLTLKRKLPFENKVTIIADNGLYFKHYCCDNNRPVIAAYQSYEDEYSVFTINKV